MAGFDHILVIGLCVGVPGKYKPDRDVDHGNLDAQLAAQARARVPQQARNRIGEVQGGNILPLTADKYLLESRRKSARRSFGSAGLSYLAAGSYLSARV